MNWNDMKTNWPKVQQQVHTKWAKLTDADLKTIGGEKKELVSCLQRHYKIDKAVAEKQADEFIGSLR